MRLTRRSLTFAAATLAAAAAVVPVATAVSGGDDGGGLSSDLGDARVAQRQASSIPPVLDDPHPLTGIGENFELVANIPLDFSSDIELHGNYAYVGTYGTCEGDTPPTGPNPPSASPCTPGTGGIVVIDISNPREPKIAGNFDCAGSQNDVQLSPDGKWAVMAIETRRNHCHPGEEGTVVLSLADPANPVEVSFLPIKTPAGNYIGSHNNTLDWPYLYIDQYVSQYNRIDIFDLTNPAAPVKLPGIQYGAPAPGFGSTSPHDLIVDHRPDGRDYLYASSGNQTSDVIDVTDPRNPVVLQRLVDPGVTFAHQSETNHDRSLTLITDEYRGGNEARACGKTATDDGPRDTPSLPGTADRNNLGALYFYRTRPDGTLEADGNGHPVIAGTYNLPLQTGNIDPALGQGCTIHIYWQAPDENRLVTSWYGKGIRVADFSDPSRVKELGWFIPTGADTWSAKPHNGYIFTGDIARGFDVLRYTGEDGKRWPSTAGPAEVQRAEIQGAPPPPSFKSSESYSANPAVNGAPTVNNNPGPARLASGSARKGFRAKLRKARRTGGVTFKKNVRLAGASREPVTVTIRSAKGGVVSRLSFPVREGQKRLRMRASIVGIAGRYRWTAEQAGKQVASGRFRVKYNARLASKLKAGQTLVCRII